MSFSLPIRLALRIACSLAIRRRSLMVRLARSGVSDIGLPFKWVGHDLRQGRATEAHPKPTGFRPYVGAARPPLPGHTLQCEGAK